MKKVQGKTDTNDDGGKDVGVSVSTRKKVRPSTAASSQKKGAKAAKKTALTPTRASNSTQLRKLAARKPVVSKPAVVPKKRVKRKVAASRVPKRTRIQ